MAKRQAEYHSLVSKADYIDGYFHKSGGYYVVHKDHNEVADTNTNKEMYAAKVLAAKLIIKIEIAKLKKG